MALMDDRVVDDKINECPHCGTSLIGDPIPDKYLHHNIPGEPFYKEREPTCEESKARDQKRQEEWNAKYPHWASPVQPRCFCLPYGEATNWRREIGHEIQGVYDGILYYTCPDCEKAWNRWTESTDRLYQEAERYVRERNERIANQ